MVLQGQLETPMSDRLVVDTGALEWRPSPAPGVWRKRLWHVGAAESGRVTSLVRFDPGARFPPHAHPDGEEIFVLAGTFSDADGDYRFGSYILNPHGTSHAPWSSDGCTILVRLRQHPGRVRPRLAIEGGTIPWQARRDGDSAEKPITRRPDGRGRTSLIRIEPCGRVPSHGHPFGEEIYVIDGEFADEFGRYRSGTWIRNPIGYIHAPRSDGGCTYLLSTGVYCKIDDSAA